MDVRAECWLVTPSAPPRLFRHCPGCRDVAAFVCADTFRVNAQKKIIDVWLNYRCAQCDGVWKYPVLERVPVTRVTGARLDAFFRNDPATVRQYAFDVERLARFAQCVEGSAVVRVRRTPIAPEDIRAPLCIRLDVPLPCAVRLDRLLAGELHLPRSAVHRLHAEGGLCVSPARRKVLSTPINNGQRVWFLDIDSRQPVCRG